MKTRMLIVAVLACGLALGSFAAQGGAAAKPKADLGVGISAAPNPATINSAVSFTAKVENLGPEAVSDVSLELQVARGVPIGAVTPAGATCHRGQKITCQIGAMPAPTADYSGPPSVTVSVTPRHTGKLTVSAVVKGTRNDPVSANNRAVATIQVNGPPVTCRGVVATIVGTPGDDILNGTPEPDVIAAFGGDDTIRSGFGRDLICGAGGADLINGGSAADRIYAGTGPDSVYGAGGPDLLKGGPGSDALHGGRGSDRLFGQAGRGDRCSGGPGRDLLKSCER
jgi:Ca2+-binding RTX toxin-like protein